MHKLGQKNMTNDAPEEVLLKLRDASGFSLTLLPSLKENGSMIKCYCVSVSELLLVLLFFDRSSEETGKNYDRHIVHTSDTDRTMAFRIAKLNL